jgi:cell division protein FtsQ
MRLLRILLSLIAAGGLGYGGYVIADSAPFKLTTVEVVGASERVGSNEIVAASGLKKGDHLLKISSRKVARGIKSIPWVERVRVERILPSKIRLTVNLRTAELVAVSGGRTFLIDASGVVLEESQEVANLPKTLVTMTGLPENELVPGRRLTLASFETASAVLASLPAAIRSEVKTVRAPSVDRVGLELSGGTLLVYGAAVELKLKNFAAQALIEKYAAEGRPVASIDVRVPTRPAVKLR